MEDPQRDEVMKDVATVVERLSEPLTLPYVTSAYTARATF
jgi:hypothetical protein